MKSAAVKKFFTNSSISGETTGWSNVKELWKFEYKSLLVIIILFLTAYFLPISYQRFNEAVYSSLHLAKWYAQEHVILCLIPAFFIAGVISVFVSQASVIKYFGAKSKKWLSYFVASVSGTILAVCSCTILPLFSGIYKRVAGLGPAAAFLYSGPAINILARTCIIASQHACYKKCNRNGENYSLCFTCYYYGNFKRAIIWNDIRLKFKINYK